MLVLAPPVSAGTRHLPGTEPLATMRPGAFLVNADPGPAAGEEPYCW